MTSYQDNYVEKLKTLFTKSIPAEQEAVQTPVNNVRKNVEKVQKFLKKNTKKILFCLYFFLLLGQSFTQ